MKGNIQIYQIINFEPCYNPFLFLFSFDKGRAVEKSRVNSAARRLYLSEFLIF